MLPPTAMSFRPTHPHRRQHLNRLLIPHPAPSHHTGLHLPPPPAHRPLSLRPSSAPRYPSPPPATPQDPPLRPLLHHPPRSPRCSSNRLLVLRRAAQEDRQGPRRRQRRDRQRLLAGWEWSWT